ncbi:MAG: ribosomal RNA small subunit methyltransferase A [Candidatus Omnitrophica bacterium]|nr:ribosomal RNA small subunit methyltransferase A [Candidatus Omnitrophota bacterium]MBU1047728.1 ribosomal RNA small subunit methyltransferase A [Candidatus Omnitrophota bacterium]MBU1631008.1 ribosomal RNA small subunit methyltransferase A [Candidatus Omnitrophota bacterium]MBU1888542.1 ribosomal RNA small subunit methyltransferase A [Candidatus Omnitrophota bacterium]
MANLHKPDLDLATPTQVKNLLIERGLSPRKFLGQHFLVDKNILKKIVETAKIKEGEKVLEIGSGIGTLTFALACEGAEVFAIEKDRGAASSLKELAAVSYPNVKVINDDILKIDLEIILRESPEWKVVSNPPYSIASPILFKLISFKKKFSCIVLMLQKEFAQRLVACPGSENYSFLSIKAQFHMGIEIIHKVSRRVFFPSPNVDSAIVLFKPLKSPRVKVCDEELFFKIADAMFRMRRKNLKNTLKFLNLPLEFYKKSPIDLTRRGETLSLEEVGLLADFITKIKIQNRHKGTK